MKKIILILAAVLLILVSAYALADSHEHIYGASWITDQNGHWKECRICGYRIGEGEHWGLRCDQGEPHCHKCGMKESEGAIIHMYDHTYGSETSFKISKTTHSYACDNCGETVTGKHYAICSNIGVCAVCGASEEKDRIVISETRSHNYVLKTLPDLYPKYHWEECTICGDIINVEEHWGLRCDQGEPYCHVCGATESEGAIIKMYNHIIDSISSITEKSHSFICGNCGQTVTEQHEDDCTNKGVCETCGASVAKDGIVISKTNHWFINESGYVTPFDAEFHQSVCTKCGDVSFWKHVYEGDSPICKYCGFDKRTVPTPTPIPAVTPTAAPTASPTAAPTATPTTPPTNPPIYSAEATFDAQQKFLHGTVTLKEGEELTRVFARITYFFADGTYTTGSVSVVDGEFEGMTSGNVIHVGIQIVDTYKVRPGEYNRFGATEFDVE